MAATVNALAATHAVPAVQALVARAAPHRDAPAHVARRGVRLHVGALLAEGVGDDGEAEIRVAFGAEGAGGLVRHRERRRAGGAVGVVEGLSRVGFDAWAVAVAGAPGSRRGVGRRRTLTPALSRSTGRGR